MNVALAIAAATGWLAAAVFAALWWGLRGRLGVLQSIGRFGTPWSSNGHKASAVEGSGRDELEEARQQLYEQEVNMMTDHLSQQLKSQGRTVSPERVRKEAERLVSKTEGFGAGGNAW